MTLKEHWQNNKPGMVREKVIGIFCLTVIALAAMVKMDEPENIIVNIVIAIAGFLTGSSLRKNDSSPEDRQ